MSESLQEWVRRTDQAHVVAQGLSTIVGRAQAAASQLGHHQLGEVAQALAIHPTSGDVYVTGWTSSNDFPFTLGGAQPASGGYQDGFVARLVRGTSEFGVQMDSFADFLNFGIAPATLWYSFFSKAEDLPWANGAGRVVLDGLSHDGVAAGALFTPDRWAAAVNRIELDAVAGTSALTVATY